MCELFVGKRGVGRHFFLPAKKTREVKEQQAAQHENDVSHQAKGEKKVDESICYKVGRALYNPSRYKWGDGAQQSPINGQKYMGLYLGCNHPTYRALLLPQL